VADAGAAKGGSDADSLEDDELLEAAAVAEEPPAAVEEHEDLDDGEGLDHAQVLAERDEFRDTMLRVKAEFDNYRKRTARDQEAMAAAAAGRMAEGLLLVLDACEAAIVQGAEDVEPIRRQLIDTLAKEGLEVIDAVGAPFDPNLHEAVLHEPAEGDEGDEGEVVVDSMRTGYLWRGQVLRPSMVKVRG
jgi:molecular chaperone GrpE